MSFQLNLKLGSHIMSKSPYSCGECQREIPTKAPKECPHCGSNKIAASITGSAGAKMEAKGRFVVGKNYIKYNFIFAVIVFALSFLGFLIDFLELPNIIAFAIGLSLQFGISLYLLDVKKQVHEEKNGSIFKK